MSSGALVNLVSKGVQDAFIIGDPQVSFFRQNYKRHTNFSMKPVELSKVGSDTANGEFRCRISDIGDLVSYIWVDAKEIGQSSASNVSVSASAPTTFELRIGGKTIDTQDGFYIDSLWSKFMATSSSKNYTPRTVGADAKTAFLPLHFFHCDEATTPLPLVALQYHECELVVRMGTNVNSAPNNLRIYANAIFLDKEDRDWFVNNQHDMLITQVQKINADSNGSDLSYFNHPVKNIMWGSDSTLDVSNVTLTVNGTDVFDNRMPGKYFTLVQPYMHCDNSGDSTIFEDTDLYMHTFASAPNRHQPTGSLNFSRLDNARIKWGVDSGSVSHIYGVNYNILTIKNGMGGVKFSN